MCVQTREEIGSFKDRECCTFDAFLGESRNWGFCEACKRLSLSVWYKKRKHGIFPS